MSHSSFQKATTENGRESRIVNGPTRRVSCSDVPPTQPTRRRFLCDVAAGSGAAALAWLPAAFGGLCGLGDWTGMKSAHGGEPDANDGRRASEGRSRLPRVAAVVTEFRFRSHAFNILENFFAPYLFRGELVEPGVEVVSMYADQLPDGDLARDVSRRFHVPLFETVEGALRRGGDRLDVDAVLLIGEHGDYPYNELGQHLYPRKQLFDRIAAVLDEAGRGVPIFNDKHLSYRWDWAKEMYDRAKELGAPLMAGSSVPLAERRPMLELPAEAEIVEAVSLHGGGLESYDFHALEVLQSMVESRRGGETGVTHVELLADDRLDEAMRQADWPTELIAAAREAERAHDSPRQPRPTTGVFTATKGDGTPPANLKTTQRHAIRLTYRDGLRATILKDGSSSDRWNFACRLRGETTPRACMFYNGPWGNRCLFKALSHAIQHHFKTGEAPYPVERTLLVTGILDAAMHSHHDGGRKLETPQLAFAYEPRDFRSFRENGASWRRLNPDKPQPAGFEPGDEKLLR